MLMDCFRLIDPTTASSSSSSPPSPVHYHYYRRREKAEEEEDELTSEKCNNGDKKMVLARSRRRVGGPSPSPMFVRLPRRLVEWLRRKQAMAFLRQHHNHTSNAHPQRRAKFSVDLQVCHISDVPFVNAVLFAKIRLLDGGKFEAHTERVEVKNHSAKWERRFTFLCQIWSDPASGELEKCLCRISVRREQKGGKSYVKLGYVDLNLAEIATAAASAGVEGVSRASLLDGYGINQRLDNSKVTVKVAMTHQSADPLFKVPKLPNDVSDEQTSSSVAADGDGAASQSESELSLPTTSSLATTSAAVAAAETGGGPLLVTPSSGASASSTPLMQRCNVAAAAAAATAAAATTTANVGGDSERLSLRPDTEGKEDAQSVCATPSSGQEQRRSSAIVTATVSTNAAAAAATAVGSTSTGTASLRRFSQDRSSAPRVHSTRVDAEGIIEAMLAETQLSKANANGQHHHHHEEEIPNGVDGCTSPLPPPRLTLAFTKNGELTLGSTESPPTTAGRRHT